MAQNAPDDNLEEQEYEVEQIVDHNITKLGRKYAFNYYIKWLNYSSEDNTWEKEKDVFAKDLIQQYWDKRPDDDMDKIIYNRIHAPKKKPAKKANVTKKDMSHTEPTVLSTGDTITTTSVDKDIEKKVTATEKDTDVVLQSLHEHSAHKRTMEEMSSSADSMENTTAKEDILMMTEGDQPGSAKRAKLNDPSEITEEKKDSTSEKDKETEIIEKDDSKNNIEDGDIDIVDSDSYVGEEDKDDDEVDDEKEGTEVEEDLEYQIDELELTEEELAVNIGRSEREEESDDEPIKRRKKIVDTDSDDDFKSMDSDLHGSADEDDSIIFDIKFRQDSSAEWDKLASTVEYIGREVEGSPLFCTVKWTDGVTSIHPLSLVRKKRPDLVIDAFIRIFEKNIQ